MAKTLGIRGTVTIGNADYECEAASIKLDQEKIELVSIGGNSWSRSIPGGVRKLSGSLEFPFDAALNTVTTCTVGGNTDTYPAPFSTDYVAVVFTIGESPDTVRTLSFDAVLSDIDIKKSNKGLTKVTCNFESSGQVTYA